ncbi:uncharacterized protein K489DRAFT_383634 [Dissoconium aciculare CBS 342.82]|uniref:Uncharacterized protein n=1 Tax=Dissoconium aciculare CBS 342.82 TaxID=1314786 RepID=A0A6J3LVV2_9PEZI|nr:uncharacterized protein K489DRAFT_383634 [Dissoconium aciculare CBS 342.82]KAF1819409.1 hypothetical protein K489DRAFT_383634 [Dissoconium aciculare CBS 342.82]
MNFPRAKDSSDVSGVDMVLSDRLVSFAGHFSMLLSHDVRSLRAAIRAQTAVTTTICVFVIARHRKHRLQPFQGWLLLLLFANVRSACDEGHLVGVSHCQRGEGPGYSGCAHACVSSIARLHASFPSLISPSPSLTTDPTGAVAGDHPVLRSHVFEALWSHGQGVVMLVAYQKGGDAREVGACGVVLMDWRALRRRRRACLPACLRLTEGPTKPNKAPANLSPACS